MHWFWRATIGIVAGCVYAGLSITAFERPHERLANTVVSLLGSALQQRGWRLGVGVAVAYFLPVLLLAFGIYGLLTRRFGPKTFADNETHCRKCGYILRGISEPRCSECGELI
jgi:hypothetical protein